MFIEGVRHDACLYWMRERKGKLDSPHIWWDGRMLEKWWWSCWEDVWVMCRMLHHRLERVNIQDLRLGEETFTVSVDWFLLKDSLELLPRLESDMDRDLLRRSDCAIISSSRTSSFGEVVWNSGSRSSTNLEAVIAIERQDIWSIKKFANVFEW